jgi:DNA repair protein RecO (recombination protein O)
MTLITVKGLVIKTVDIKESDRFLTIFSEEMGIISAYAQGARTLKSRKMASTMQFCYGNFVLMQRGDKYWVKEADLIESFFDIRKTIEGLALAGYILEVLSDVAVAVAERELLRLALNSLYAISTAKYELEKIKAAFEIRAASIIGFMPDVISCYKCDEQTGEFFFDIMGGRIECAKCREEAAMTHDIDTDPHEAHIICVLSEGAKIALGYCIHSPVEKIFSFKISDEDMRLFSKAAEQYILNQLERSFKSLDFYNEVKPKRKT